MFIPYLADVSMKRWPIANWVLMGATVAISIAMFGPLAEWHDSFSEIAVVNGHLAFVAPPAEGVLNHFLLQPNHFSVSQLVGSTLIHTGYLHLLGNMLFLWVFGNAINAKLGQLWFLAFYFGAAIFEGTIYTLFSNVPCLGASGAIMAVVGAFLVLYPRNDIRIFWTFWYRIGFGTISAIWLIAIYVAFDIWGLVTAGSGVAYVAHVAGAAFGIGLTMILLKTGVLTSAHDEENLLNLMGLQKMTHEQEVAFGLKPWRDPTATSSPTGGVSIPTRPAAVGRAKARPRDDGPLPLD